MTTDQNKALVRRLVEEAQAAGNLALVDELLAPDFIDHSPLPSVPPTRDGVRALFAALHAAFPDLQITIHEQLAEGDKVMTRKTFAGTHQGEFLGVPATGRPVQFDVIDILRVANGKLTEHRCLVDQLALLQQLGVVAAG